MQTNPRSIRIVLGCGYESLNPAADPWIPPDGDLGFDGEVTVCPGYSTHLPEVFEVMRARTHWKNGALRDYCDGEQPSEQMLEAIEVLDIAAASCERYWDTPVKDGGGQT